MAISRADTLTQLHKKKELYSDFLNSFFATPTTGSLAKTINENSVKQSIKNLVLTVIGERFFQPYVGSNVNDALFDFNDILTHLNAKNFIENTIKNYEPRANNINVSIVTSDDPNYLDIRIVFYIINNPEPIDLVLNIKRVR